MWHKACSTVFISLPYVPKFCNKKEHAWLSSVLTFQACLFLYAHLSFWKHACFLLKRNLHCKKKKQMCFIPPDSPAERQDAEVNRACVNLTFLKTVRIVIYRPKMWDPKFHKRNRGTNTIFKLKDCLHAVSNYSVTAPVKLYCVNGNGDGHFDDRKNGFWTRPAD